MIYPMREGPVTHNSPALYLISPFHKELKVHQNQHCGKNKIHKTRGIWVRHDGGGWSVANHQGFTWLEPLDE
jgi:hypothetical protein